MKKLLAVAALAVMLCLTGMVMSGEAQARFTDNGNGTVTDTQTGLMWTTDANLFGEVPWFEAMARCSSFSISGIGGWRLPSKDELLALYYATSFGHPFIRLQQSTYWSSEIDRGTERYAYFVNMRYGSVYSRHMTETGHAWPVRAGQ